MHYICLKLKRLPHKLYSLLFTFSGDWLRLSHALHPSCQGNERRGRIQLFSLLKWILNYSLQLKLYIFGFPSKVESWTAKIILKNVHHKEVCVWGLGE